MSEENICNNCRRSNPDDAMFCIYCGNRLMQKKDNHNICLHCGNLLSDDAKFCSTCGNLVEQRKYSEFQQIPAQNGFYDDCSVVTNSQPDYNQSPVVSQGTWDYSQEQEPHRRTNNPRTFKKKVSKVPRADFNPMLVPIILLIIAAISAFIVTWQITVFIALIAVVLLFHTKKQGELKNRPEWMY